MTIQPAKITDTVTAGPGHPLVVLAGPCVIESRELCLSVAEHMRMVCAKLGLQYVFKASFDKANRTSIDSFRGPGLDEGLAILAEVKAQLGVPVVTDVHETHEVAAAGDVVDVLQIPAFLCRQTDLLVAAGRTGRTVNVKKGQFLAPEDMAPAVGKIRSTGNPNIMLTERGTSFGYHNLVVDMRGLVTMAELGVPVVFDCTHAVQIPGGKGTASGGRREFVHPLARAAAAVGIHALFVETHPDPGRGLSDGPNMIPLDGMEALLQEVKAIHELGD